MATGPFGNAGLDMFQREQKMFADPAMTASNTDGVIGKVLAAYLGDQLGFFDLNNPSTAQQIMQQGPLGAFISNKLNNRAPNGAVPPKTNFNTAPVKPNYSLPGGSLSAAPAAAMPMAGIEQDATNVAQQGDEEDTLFGGISKFANFFG